MSGSESIPLLSQIEESDVSLFEDEFKKGQSKRKQTPSLTLWERVRRFFSKPKTVPPRRIKLTGTEYKAGKKSFAPNVIRNQKYNVFTFVPFCLYEQFKYFINFYYLIISISQFVPALKVGYTFTYVAPLAFVVALSMAKEAYDDYKRMVRDKACNSETYKRLAPDGRIHDIPASEIKVGHVIVLETNRRVPADILMLKTSEETGASFIRTDQLDGETDWKLRRAVSITQKTECNKDIFATNSLVFAKPPEKDVYRFTGNFTTHESEGEIVESLSLDNTLWASTVVASGTVTGLVLYTGRDTRSQMNTSQPPSKKGILDKEINVLTVILCILQVVLALTLVTASVFKGVWWLNFFLFNILFSNIIPISMRVNMDFAKLLYSFLIMNDKDIPGCTVRNTSIPEELGRISYLLSDKTGTLTQNEMQFRKLQLGQINFDQIDDIKEDLNRDYFSESSGHSEKKIRLSSSAKQIITAIALCHNVTPAVADDGSHGYQASSPDEVALVKFTESVGMTLYNRTLTSITLKNPRDEFDEFDVLKVFPFTSARKRMGIIIKSRETEKILFIMKGADVIMRKIALPTDWLDEACDNLARDGLRTLVFAQREFSEKEYETFDDLLHQAEISMEAREEKIEEAINSIENGLVVLGLTGVEDKLQEKVRDTLEMLRGAGIKIWMLTGDKRETAHCIGVSTKLIARSHNVFHVDAKNVDEAREQLQNFILEPGETVMVVDGDSLQIFFDHFEMEFFTATQRSPSVICCRCAPDQKAQVVRTIKKYSNKQTAAVGDGGNDVSMIQAADIGIGIVGKEGKQASLASDFSVDQFSHIGSLFLWHGRNSYHRSAMLSQFVIHRGTIITIIQFVFSAIFFMSPVTIFTGMLLFGYSCWYTMFPVFVLTTDEDVCREDVFRYPELYQSLRKGRSLSINTFLIQLLVSLYQGTTIAFGGFMLGNELYLTYTDITFTSLILVLLLNVLIVFNTWNLLLILSEIATLTLYIMCMIIFRFYYDIEYISSFDFWYKTLLIVFASCAPVWLIKVFFEKINPPANKKLKN